jgi:hypothetical protein
LLVRLETKPIRLNLILEDLSGVARIQELDSPDNDIRASLARSFQSARVNFLFGAGASWPAIPIAGNLEQEIADLFEAGEEDQARAKMYEFLVGIQGPTNKLIDNIEDASNTSTLEFYRNCLGAIEIMLRERRTDLLPKQATVFTTNYDLLIEQASATFATLNLNDGFIRAPRLDGRIQYSSRMFFTQTYNTGNVYDYKVEIPSVNFVKLHGSLSWTRDGDQILCRISRRELLPTGSSAAAVKSFVESYALVLPQTSKFRTTLMERTYYELLRIYANELDKANTLLITFGFSFSDSHILDITRKALKNPTLKLVAFAFNDTDRIAFANRFDANNNVDIVAPRAGERIDFQRFNVLLRDVLPRME